MRVPRLSQGSRARLLGLGIFMIAISTTAEFVSSLDADTEWGRSHTAAIESGLLQPGAPECTSLEQDNASVIYLSL
jgi:hypothetical protein